MKSDPINRREKVMKGRLIILMVTLALVAAALAPVASAWTKHP